MILLAIILMLSFYVLSRTDDDGYIYWRVMTGVVAFCILWTLTLTLI